MNDFASLCSPKANKSMDVPIFITTIVIAIIIKLLLFIILLRHDPVIAMQALVVVLLIFKIIQDSSIKSELRAAILEKNNKVQLDSKSQQVTEPVLTNTVTSHSYRNHDRPKQILEPEFMYYESQPWWEKYENEFN